MTSARFLCDVSLERIARRLRALGFDTASAGSVRLEDLLAAARREHRIALTTSARHPRRFADVPAVVLRRDDASGSVRFLADTYEAAGPPFSRCLCCNRALETRPAREAGAEVPEAVRASATELRHCASCGRWYWHGSHVDRLERWLESSLGRPITGAER